MTAVARLVDPGLRRERGIEPSIEGDTADRLPVQDVVIRGLQRRGKTNRQLLLTPTELGVILLDHHAL